MMHLPEHISHQFDRELEDLRSRVLAMGGLLEAHLLKVLDALSTGRTELAESVCAERERIEHTEQDIEDHCTEVLLRRQPAAIDLRLVLATSKIIADLAYASNEIDKVAETVVNATQRSAPREHDLVILNLGHKVRRLLVSALDAFARMDSDLAEQTAEGLATVDVDAGAALRQLVASMAEAPSEQVSRQVDALLASRSLLRVAEYATNICHHTFYVLTSRNLRHVVAG